MVMNDTCATHRSRVPRRSFGRVKWGVTTVEDERRPGLDFSLCFVCGSHPWGAATFHLCLFILLLKCLKCSPVPASFFPYLLTSLHCYLYIFSPYYLIDQHLFGIESFVIINNTLLSFLINSMCLCWTKENILKEVLLTPNFWTVV